MFWKSTFQSFSPIQAILNKENFTVEELLEEDDLIQECRALNSKLVSFLERKDVVEKLLGYVVDPPSPSGAGGEWAGPDDGSDLDLEGPESEAEKRRTRYPFAACEVFCCDVDSIFNTLLENDSLMNRLFGLLSTPAPLHPINAGYFGRVASSLLVRRPTDVLSYCLGHQDVLTGLLRHVANPSISEVLVRILGADEHVAPLLAPYQMQQLSQTTLLGDLVALLTEAEPEPEARAQGARILAAIANSQSIRESPLAQQLGTQGFLSRLLDSGLAEGPSQALLVSVLSVILALLEPRRGIPGFEDVGGDHLPGDPKVRDATVTALLPNLSRLVGLLGLSTAPGSGVEEGLAAAPSTWSGAGVGARLDMPYGTLAPPLGTARLRIVELLSLLGKKGGVVAQEAMIGSGAIRAVLDLFRAYPFNNLLHRRVQQIVMDALEGDGPILNHLLKDCGVLSWLASLPREVEPMARPGFEARTLRAGYMGHVNDMGNRLLELGATREDLRRVMESDKVWASWVQGSLRRESLVAALDAWRCGRPSGEILGKLGPSVSDFSSYGTGNPFLHQPLDDDDEDEDEDDLDDDDDDDDEPQGAGAASTAPVLITFGGAGLAGSSLEDESDLTNRPPSGAHRAAAVAATFESLSLSSVGSVGVSGLDAGGHPSDTAPRHGSGARKRYSSNPSGLESPPALDDFGLAPDQADVPGLPLSSGGGGAVRPGLDATFEADWGAAGAGADNASSNQGLAISAGQGSGEDYLDGPDFDAWAVATSPKGTPVQVKRLEAEGPPEEEPAPEFLANNYWAKPMPEIIDGLE